MLTADGHEITKGMTVYENPKSGTGLKALVVVARPGAGAMFVSCRTAEGRLLCRRNPSHLLFSPAAARGDADGAVTARTMLDCIESGSGWNVREQTTGVVIGTGQTCEQAWVNAADNLYVVIRGVHDLADPGSPAYRALFERTER